MKGICIVVVGMQAIRVIKRGVTTHCSNGEEERFFFLNFIGKGMRRMELKLLEIIFSPAFCACRYHPQFYNHAHVFH